MRLGSSGTYNKLIKVFEHANVDHKDYADIIRTTILKGLEEIEMSIGKVSYSSIL